MSLCKSFWDCGLVALDDITIQLGNCWSPGKGTISHFSCVSLCPMTDISSSSKNLMLLVRICTYTYTYILSFAFLNRHILTELYSRFYKLEMKTPAFCVVLYVWLVSFSSL